MPRRQPATAPTADQPIPAAVPDFEAWLAERHEAADTGAATKGKRTRARLLTAAARALQAQGFDGFGLAEVCREAGVTRTALYKHFPNRQSLVLALVDDFQTFLAEALRHGRKSRDPNASAGRDDAVMATNLAYVQLFRSHARLIHAVQQARHALDDAERLKFEMNAQWARKVALAIEGDTGQSLPSVSSVFSTRGTKARNAASREALATAYALEAMVDGFLTEWILRRNPHLAALKLSDVEVARILTAVWRGVSGRAV